MGGVITLYIAMLVILHMERGYISRRHCVPLVIFMVFYIPSGIESMAQWWCGKTKKNSSSDIRRMTLILLVTGMGICLPKLLSNKSSKAGYAAAAVWINANTAKNAVIAVPDLRITFYAERKGILIKSPKDHLRADYYVELVEGNGREGEVSYWVDQRKKKKVVIYHNIEK